MVPQNSFEQFTFRQRESGLLVPDGQPDGAPHALGIVVAQTPLPPGPTMILPFKPVVRDGLLAYVSESELELSTLGRKEIAERLKRLPSEIVFLNLALLLRRLARIRDDASAHLELARLIYEDAPVMEGLGRWCATPGHVIFTEQGLFALLAQAITHCRDDAGGAFTAQEWSDFKRLLLAAPGLLHDDAEIGEYQQGEPEEWLVYFTQNLLFNASADFGSGLGRTWRLFGELAVDESRRWNTPLDFTAVLKRSGLSIEQQLALGFSLYASIGVDDDGTVISPERWRELCERVEPGRSAEEVIAQISYTPAEMRSELTSDVAKRFDPNLRWSSIPFIEHPFLRLEDGRLLLVSPRGIEGWPTNGVYYRLLRAARELDPKNGVQHFTSFVGDLTEVATIEMVEDAHARAQEKHLGLGRVQRARPLKNGGESTDLFVIEGGDVVLLEINSSRITARTRLTGDLEKLREDLGKVVVKRVEQLHRTTEAILNDEFGDIPAHGVKRIFPVIVGVEPVQWSPMLHAFLLREVPDMLQQHQVQPLQFVEIEDLEALMSAVGPPSLARLIERKIQEVGIDSDVMRWFHDSPIAPRPRRPAIVTRWSSRQFRKMAILLGFEDEMAERLVEDLDAIE